MPLRYIRSRAGIPFVIVALGGFGAPGAAFGTAFATAFAFGAAFATDSAFGAAFATACGGAAAARGCGDLLLAGTEGSTGA